MLDLDYGSSSEGEDDRKGHALPSHPRPAKRRRLPPLGGSFEDDAPAEDPARYQGRTLARPKVVGDYPTHLYLAFDVPPCFHALVDHAQALVPELHSLIDPPRPSSPTSSDDRSPAPSTSKRPPPLKLHVSLSRPLYVRKEQRPKLEAALRDAIARTPPFELSFSALRVLRNDEQTRIFLGVDVAAGYPEITALTERINEVLGQAHLPPYYENPLFHASVAWALLRPNPAKTPDDAAANGAATTMAFPSVEDLPADVLGLLRVHCDPIRRQGGKRVGAVWMKFGAEEVLLPLEP